MANTKSKSTTKPAKTDVVEVKTTNENTTGTSQNVQAGPSYEDLAALVKSLSAKVDLLTREKEEALNNPENTAKASDSDKLGELVNVMTSRKSDKEISIVHCCEVGPGLSTHIQLSTLSLDMRTVGEERTLSWAQFEECVSKYRSFFERGVIKVGSKFKEIAERYNVPCISDDTDKAKLTHGDIERIPGMTARELEDFINTLSETDQNTVISYCLGKCYTREPGFYDRYKMETLGRLAKNEAFAGLIMILNDEEVRAMRGSSQATQIN